MISGECGLVFPARRGELRFRASAHLQAHALDGRAFQRCEARLFLAALAFGSSAPRLFFFEARRLFAACAFQLLGPSPLLGGPSRGSGRRFAVHSLALQCLELSE